MELRHLQSFVEVAERRSFVRAAASLHISQPAITAHIHRLEQDIGVMLLERTKRSVKLTVAGEAFLAGAHATLSQAQEAIRTAQLAGKSQARLLRVGCPPSVLTEIMPRVVTEFHKIHPDVGLELRSSHTSIIVASLQDESIDIGYVRLPVAIKGLTVVPVHREPFVVCLPLNHALAASKTVAFEDLRGERFIVYGRKWAPGFHDRIADLCEQAGVSLSDCCSIDEMYLAPSLVAGGQGIAIVPRMVVGHAQRNVAVRELGRSDNPKTPPGTPICSELGVAMRNREISQLTKSLVAISRHIGRQSPLQSPSTPP
jgi:DNA-binding transcriptional LysR family regulator